MTSLGKIRVCLEIRLPWMMSCVQLAEEADIIVPPTGVR